MIVSISGSGCWWAHGADWHATKPYDMRWRGPTTSSKTLKGRSWSGVRCSPADSTSKARAPSWVPTDDLATLDLLDALVRKSLLVADRSSGRTRFSMLETIRQFAEEQLVARGEATEIRAAHCPLLRRTRSRHHGPVGQPPPAGGLRLVHRRAGQSAHRVPVGRRPRRPRCHRHHRHVCGIPRLEGRNLTSP